MAKLDISAMLELFTLYMLLWQKVNALQIYYIKISPTRQPQMKGDALNGQRHFVS